MSEFGTLIRDARERLGLSPHRVAELIGRAPGTVKAWERGRTVPNDPFVVTSLAAVLAVEEHALFEAAGMEPPVEQPHLTIEQELASIAPRAEVARARTESDQDSPTVSAAPLDRLTVTSLPAPLGPPITPEVVRRRRVSERPQRPAAPVSLPVTGAATGSFLDDPDERWSYRLRAVWTTVGVAVLGVILLWAGSRTMTALGDAWDALLAGL